MKAGKAVSNTRKESEARESRKHENEGQEEEPSDMWKWVVFVLKASSTRYGSQRHLICGSGR